MDLGASLLVDKRDVADAAAEQLSNDEVPARACLLGIGRLRHPLRTPGPPREPPSRMRRIDGSDGTRTRDLRRDRPVWKPVFRSDKPKPPVSGSTISGTHRPVWYPKWYPNRPVPGDLPHGDIVQRRARDPRADRPRLLRGQVARLARTAGQAPCRPGVGRARPRRRVAPARWPPGAVAACRTAASTRRR